MKKLFLATTAMTAITSVAHAGGIERSTQSVGILFEEGRYVEFGLTLGRPDVSGVGPDLPPPATTSLSEATGDMTENFTNLSLSFKDDINEDWTYALVLDQPFGADVFYPTGTTNLFTGSNATFDSLALTGLLQYNVGNGASVYGGVRAQTISAEATLPFAGYTVEGDRQLRFGYVLGAAYEKPEIALRVALTYNSQIDYDLDTTETTVAPAGSVSSEVEVNTPQSLNLEFQSGVAEDTLVFGSVRWVEWSEFSIRPPVYASIFTTNPDLVAFEDDRITYTLGLGRRLNETWSVLGSVSYEETTGSVTGNLGPTDGFTSVALGAVYTKDNMKITGGVRYVDIGEATTTAGATFDDNSAIGAGLRVGWSF